MKSISNAQVKHIRLLQQKKYRQKYSQFVVEGLKSVLEFLHSKYTLNILVCTNEWLERNENTFNKPIILAKNEIFKKISSLKNPSGVLAVFNFEEVKNTIDYNQKIALYLDDIRDPGNFGTIIRTADWFGLNQIFCSPNSVDYFNSKVVQASMGSLAHIHIHYCEIKAMISKNYKIVIADLHGKDFQTTKFKEKTVLVIGNEANGVTPEIKKEANTRITIPKKGKAESLNAAISTGILLQYYL